jgi:hypothetical protein
VLAGLVVVCLIAAVAVGVWFVRRDDGGDTPTSAATFGAPAPTSAAAGRSTAGSTGQSSDASSSTTSSSRTTSSSSAPPTSAAPTPTASGEAGALAELQSLRAGSLARLDLDGRWVAQVASKSVGITDPLQVAANGTHTFYAVDILAESKAAVASVSSSSVLVLQSTDFGKVSVSADGQPYWVTLVDAGFSSSDDVDLWCARTYSQLTAEQLANACAARTLAPPHA